MRAPPFVVGTLGLMLSACGSGTPEIPEELLQGAETNDGSYPSGPYGAEIGDTIENFSFEGYVNAEVSRELEPISFADYYDPDGEQGIKLLLLNTSAVWCQACVIEHATLADRTREFEEEGLRIISLLFQDADGAGAGVEELDFWVENFDSNYVMALDPSYQMGRYGPAETPPVNLIVDPTDMTIIASFIGNQEGPMWELVERELEERN